MSGTILSLFKLVFSLIIRYPRHDVYRPILLNHLLTVSIRHWDPVMRRLGAQSIRAICQLDLWKLGTDCIERAVCTASNAIKSVL